jgi:hypothetical protein
VANRYTTVSHQRDASVDREDLQKKIESIVRHRSHSALPLHQPSIPISLPLVFLRLRLLQPFSCNLLLLPLHQPSKLSLLNSNVFVFNSTLSTSDPELIEVALVAEVVDFHGRGSGRRRHLSGRGRGRFSNHLPSHPPFISSNPLLTVIHSHTHSQQAYYVATPYAPPPTEYYPHYYPTSSLPPPPPPLLPYVIRLSIPSTK